MKMRRAGCNVIWAVLITCVTASPVSHTTRSHDPKNDVEAVPGLIYPNVINKVCMIRSGYECRWTLEKSCSCNLVEPNTRKSRVLDITYYRKIIPRRHGESAELVKCENGDKCIIMS